MLAEDIKPFITLQHPTDFRISQGFGKNFKVNGKWFYGEILKMITKHNGIDYACPHWSQIAAPCRMEITNFYYENKDAGYGTTVWAKSEPFEINGKTYRLEFVFAHLDSFLIISRGLWINQGEIFALSDNTGKYTTGAHLHWGVRPIIKTWYGGWLVVNKNNGVLGYIDPMPLIASKLTNLNNNEDDMLFVKTSFSPNIYLIRNEKRIMIIDMPTLKAYQSDVKEISEDEMESYPKNGTLVWVEREIY